MIDEQKHRLKLPLALQFTYHFKPLTSGVTAPSRTFRIVLIDSDLEFVIEECTLDLMGAPRWDLVPDLNDKQHGSPTGNHFPHSSIVAIALRWLARNTIAAFPGELQTSVLDMGDYSFGDAP